METEKKVMKSNDELALDRTNLAYERTALANDRTLMAWVRTATSLISFGFTIYKFFQEMHNTDPLRIQSAILSSREVGMILILFGFLGLFFGLLQYRSDMKRIRASYTEVKLVSFAPILSILILIFSLLLFFSVLYRQ